MDTNYVTRDNFGMYADSTSGPGPALMGADTLLGNDVYNKDGEDLGDIKEFMIDMATGKVAYAVLSFGGVLGLGRQAFRRALGRPGAGHREQALHAQRREGSAERCTGLRQGPLAGDVGPHLGQRRAQVLRHVLRPAVSRSATLRTPSSHTSPQGSAMNKDQVKGTLKSAAGEVQEKAGQVIGSSSQQAKGVGKQVEGRTQKVAGDIKEVAKDFRKK